MKINKMLVAAAMTLAAAGSAQAQSTINCGGSGEAAIGLGTCVVLNTVSAAVPSVARMSITGPNTTILTAPLAADFGTAGSGNLVTTAGPTITVSSNVAHTVTASSPSSWTGPVSSSKPATDLQIKVNALSFAAIGPLSGSTPATNLATYALTFGNKYNWTVDIPGTYTLALTFTLTSP